MPVLHDGLVAGTEHQPAGAGMSGGDGQTDGDDHEQTRERDGDRPLADQGGHSGEGGADHRGQIAGCSGHDARVQCIMISGSACDQA